MVSPSFTERPASKDAATLLLLHDLSFELSEPEAYARDVPTAEAHILDAGNFALDTAADQIAQLVRGFM